MSESVHSVCFVSRTCTRSVSVVFRRCGHRASAGGAVQCSSNAGRARLSGASMCVRSRQEAVILCCRSPSHHHSLCVVGRTFVSEIVVCLVEHRPPCVCSLCSSCVYEVIVLTISIDLQFQWCALVFGCWWVPAASSISARPPFARPSSPDGNGGQRW
jgi:hypothetical protein